MRKKNKGMADIIIDRIEEKLPGFKNEIDIYEIATPLTIKRFTKASGGTPYGFSQTVKNSPIFRFKNECKFVKNLYYASAWCRPGGGFTGSILSGAETSAILLVKGYFKKRCS